MTVWQAMDTPLREALTVCAMVLLLCQSSLALALLRLRRHGKLTAAAVLSFFAAFALLFFLLDGMFHRGEPAYPRTWNAATAAFCTLLVYIPMLLEVLLAGNLFWQRRMLRRYREDHPTPWSVKETMDLLPAGIAFAEADGNVVFANLTMNELARALTGKILTDLTPLWERAGAGEKKPGTLRVAFPEGTRVWQLFPARVTVNGKTYLQLTATDITLQAEINEELQGKNKKLREIRRRLEIYNRQAEQIIISQELLNARMQVHNETGHILLASRSYLDRPDAVDEAALLHSLKLANAYLLREFEEDDTQREALAEAMEMAGAIGVAVKLHGIIPEGGTPRAILAAAIGECATNIRKHADGDMLLVETKKTDGEILFILTGSGEPAEKPIAESGGLASLRMLAENAGGSMAVSASPVFTLSIRLPIAENGSRGG